jgi:hypothetical protein
MKISELLVESQQLDEGPILNKIGSAVGKGVGAVAKGVGAVAGGVAGLGSAVKKGFQAGKATVGGAGDNADPAADNRNILQKVRDTMPGSKATAATGGSTAQTAQDSPAPATGGSTAQTTQPPQSTNNKAPAQNKSTSAFGKLSGAAAGQPTDNAAVSGGTQYAQVKANIDKLDKKGKQRILQLLQKEVGTVPATPKPTPAKSTAGVAPAKPAAAPTATTTKPASVPAAPGKVLRKPRALQQPAAGEVSAAEPAATTKKSRTKAAPTQAEIDADRERIMGVTSDSIIRTRPMMAEGFNLVRKR